MKKTLLWLVVLLLALSPAAQAVTFTDVDIQYPIFPWGEHTLQLSRYTDDPDLIAYSPTPAQGSLVMLSLSSLSGAIPLEDVRAALSQFTLEDAGQTAYVPMDCLVKGISFKDSLPTTMAASQRGFDLLYYLPQGVATDGTALLVGNPDDQERAFVQLPAASADGTAPAATAQAETVAAEPTAAPTAPAEPLTSPASADILFSDTTYHITPIQIGTDENGKTTVTVSGYGDSLQIQDGKTVAHVQAKIEAGGQEFDWDGMSLNAGNATFTFDTTLPPEVIYVFASGDAANRTALTVLPSQNAAGAAAAPEASAEAPASETPEPSAENTPEPTPDATPTPTPFTVTVDGVAYSVYVEAAGFNEDGNFEVTIVLPDYGIMDFFKDKTLAIPVGCGIVSDTKVSFVETFSATVSDPLRVSYEYDTKKATPPLLLIGRRVDANKSKDPFVIVETATLAKLGEVSASGLKNGEQGVLEAAGLAAPAATATPAPAATPRPGANAEEGFLNDIMAMEAQSVKDPWTRAILMAGAADVTLADGVLTFQLRSYVPNLKALGKDFTAEALYRNIAQYALPCTLKVTGESGSLTAEPKEVKALLKAVAKAAAQAKKEFANKAVLAAITARLSGDPLTGSDAGLYAALFATQNKLKFNLKDGPDALVYSAMYADTDTLLENGRTAALQRIAHMEGANALASDEVERIFREELAAQAATLKKKASWNAAFTFGIDTLFAAENPGAGDEYATFLSRYAKAYASQLSVLKDDTAALPDYPAVDMPATGWLNGSTSGTRVIFRIPKDGFARYVQMRSAETDALSVSAFIQPGKTASVRVPRGMYYLLIAVGDLWYGTEHLFGDTGDYISTEQLEILGSNYYHTLTLGGAKNGNMSSYGADPSEFR